MTRSSAPRAGSFPPAARPATSSPPTTSRRATRCVRLRSRSPRCRRCRPRSRSSRRSHRARPAWSPRRPVASTSPETIRVTLAQAINAGLAAVLERHPNALLFGEDIAVKGGVYGVTRGLHARFGAGRVFDTLLDETSILGLALGAAVSGFLPIPEIQYLAYLHNAEDQLRGEAATLQFFSQRAYRNGMVIRIAGYGYQRGFGGHFHNDDAVGVLRDIPGLVIASPARPDDAAAMLVTCAESALVDGAVCVFLEPIALYHARDLHEDGDEGWVAALADEHVPVGSARTYLDGADLTIVTWANGFHLSLRVARKLAERGIHARVLDLRWLAPLPVEDILREAERNRARARRRRDAADGRRLGGRGRRARRRRLRRAHRTRDEQGLVRAARRRGATRPRLGGRDRGRGPRRYVFSTRSGSGSTSPRASCTSRCRRRRRERRRASRRR